MDTFIELIDIFDKQDAKAAMRDYLASISAARKLQKRLSTITKKRKKVRPSSLSHPPGSV